MGYLRTTRCIELSTIDYLETQINANWSGVTTVKAFTQVYSDTINVPVVCVRLIQTMSNRREIGATTLNNNYLIQIDIFAKSDGQRLDLADFITDKLKDGWTYYTYSQQSGNKEVLDETASGYIIVTSFNDNSKIEMGDNVELKDKFRHSISISVRKSE